MRHQPYVYAQPPTGQLISIQYLRAVIAMMVVVFHIGTQAHRLGYVGDWPLWMSRGVDVFFVISGFVMWTTTRARHNGPIDFYKRRLVRIVPLYWLLTSFSVVLMLLTPGVVKSGRFDFYHALASYLFIPATNLMTGAIEPVLASGWTLNCEMFFYAAFGALLLLPTRWHFATMTACLSAAMLLGTIFSGQIVFQFYGASILLEFGYGMIIGAMFLRGWMLAPGWACVSITAGFLALALGSDSSAPRVLASGLPALAIVIGCLSLEAVFRQRKIWIMQLLGDASYSLYLSHGIVLSAGGQIALLFGLDRLPGIVPLFIISGVVTAAVASLVMYRTLEMPLMRLLSVRYVN